jgi:3-oxoadipate enol-lactonase
VNPQSIAVREIILKNEPQGIVEAIEALKTRPDSTPTLKQIACPALVIVGDQDEVTPINLAEVMAHDIPQATLTVLSGAAHLASMQQPDAFNRALWAFITP